MSAVNQLANNKKELLLNNFVLNDLNLNSSFSKNYVKKVLDRNRVIKSTTKSDFKNEYYDELLIVIRCMQLLGALTISQDKNGKIRAKFLSLSLFYSIILYSILTYFSYMVFIRRIYWLAGKSLSFDDSVLHFNAFIFMCAHFVPLISFLERWKIADYLDSWFEFQMKYYKITGSYLSFKMKLKQIILLVILLILLLTLIYGLWSAMVTQDVDRTVGYRDAELFFYLITHVYYAALMAGFSSFWYFCMSGVQQAATQLLHECQKSKLNFINNIEEYRNLWIDLKNLCSKPGQALCLTSLYYFAFMFLLLITALYAMSSTSAYESFHVGMYLRVLFAAVLFFFTSVIGNCAYSASAKVGEYFKRELFDYVSVEKNRTIKKKLQWFVHNISINPPIVSLNGYVSLNRSFNVSMYASLLTYLVVILQFKMSGNGSGC